MKNSQKGLQEVFSSIYAEFLARIEKIRCFLSDILFGFKLDQFVRKRKTEMSILATEVFKKIKCLVKSRQLSKNN